MALFDPERKRIVIRVVYDGPGFAGKTTNLQRLSKAFASWRRSELVSPNTLGERTQYFDWLEVDGGLLRSYPLRAQLLTVPGQRELGLRRKFVIERADVVVFVADSRPEGVAEAREFYAELCEQLAGFEHPVPVVFQANKQDLPGALRPPKLVREVCQGLPRPTQVRGAVATTDRGAKQTLTVALRLGSKELRRRWQGEQVREQTGEVGDPESTYAALERSEARQTGTPKAGLRPALPSAELPSTHLWPPTSGRAVLEQLAGVELVQVSREDPRQRLVLDGRGWRFTTGERHFFTDEDEALAHMWQLTRRKVALASWLPEPSVVALQPDPEGAGLWLWSVDPILPTLAEALAGEDADLGRDALARYAEVCVGAAALAERHQLIVDLDPANFAVQSGDRPMTRYVGERLEPGDRQPGVAEAVIATAERFAADEIGVSDFNEVLCLGFHRAPADEDQRRTLGAEFEAQQPRSGPANVVRDAVIRVLSRPARP